jgi:hypothetical protein
MNRAIRKLTRAVAIVTASIGVVLCGTSLACAQQGAAGLKDQIVGTWTLVAQYAEQGDRKVERFGPNPKGFSIFESNGRFMSILMRPDLPKFASNNAMSGTVDENKAVVQGSAAFYGTWSVNDKDLTVSTRIEGSTFPNWDGQDQKRTVSLSGDEMKLCVPGAQIGGTACAVWKRLK